MWNITDPPPLPAPLAHPASKTMSNHIVVVGAGAGIAGLASAVALRQSGHGVTVVDDRGDTSTGNAITLWPNALAACDALGMAAVGADGIGSIAAQYLNGPMSFRYTGHTAWRGIAQTPIADDVAGLTLGAGLEFGHLPKSTIWYGVLATGWPRYPNCFLPPPNRRCCAATYSIVGVRAGRRRATSCARY